MAREDVFGGALLVERDFLGESAIAAHALERYAQGLHGMLHRVHDGGRLVAAMHHALGAFLVIAGAVGIPIGLAHQLGEGLGIALAEQIARALPAEIVARRVAPGRAVVALVAGEEVEEQRGLAERPVLAAVAALEDAAEQLLGLAPIEEMRLVGRALIGI